MTAKSKLIRTSILIGVVLAIGLALTFLVQANNRNIQQSQATAQVEETQEIRDFTPPGTQDGDPPVLTEFGDFQCPYCARFAMGAMQEIRRDLVDTGLIRFEYRHYPFLGPESFMAAEASECARDQGQFRQYHDQVYRSALTGRSGPVTKESLEETARLLSLDTDEFRACTQNRIHEDRVKQDRDYGRSLGVQGTPSLYIDEEKLRWESYQDLRDQLSAKIGKTP